jgi:predicted aldo/keto reductase-like oxidoreductase
MPLCAFRVQLIRCNENNHDIQIEIVLEELSNESIKLKTKKFSTKTKTTSDIDGFFNIDLSIVLSFNLCDIYFFLSLFS